MQTTKISVTDSAWTTVLANGGSALLSAASGAIYFVLESGPAPALDAPAHLVPDYELRGGRALSVDVGVKLYVRAAAGACDLVVSA